MAKITIFKDSILLDSLKNKKLEKLIKSILENEINLNSSVRFSNVGGYQTKEIWNEEVCLPILSKASNLITENFNFQKCKFKMLNLWINKNFKNNFNMMHNHPLSDFSGVFYLDVPENGGELIFYRGDRCNQILNIQSKISNLDFNENFVLKPLKYQFVLFPSHLLHMVFPHSEDAARICVSFNIKVING
tara:strand:- start:121 stop:690 length:570 start_codon:yes stop_codon:yes gene_type:complete